MSTFYKVDEKDIRFAEEQMRLTFPSELRDFYLKNGYGFFDSNMGNFNRLMDPLSVADFRLHQNDFEFMESAEMYDALSDNKLVFFEVSDGFFLEIELTTKYTQ